MDALDLLVANLRTPIVLAFALGVFARIVKSDLEIPAPVSSAISIYLLLAIGLQGGAALAVTPASEVVGPVFLAIVLGVLTPLSAYAIAKRHFDESNAGALAAHYGGVSTVTLIAALAATEAAGVPAEAFLPALYPVVDLSAIVVALVVFSLRTGSGGSWGATLHGVLAGKGIVLLAGGVAIGWIAGPGGTAAVDPFFVTAFQGILALFLLELGMLAASRIREMKGSGRFLVIFAVMVPLVHGTVGVFLASLIGMSVGGAVVLGAMVASASYISAPVAVRIVIPDANPSIYLGAALGVTFPFNLIIGIPLYIELAQRLA